jgi:hypothetical protein
LPLVCDEGFPALLDPKRALRNSLATLTQTVLALVRLVSAMLGCVNGEGVAVVDYGAPGRALPDDGRHSLSYTLHFFRAAAWFTPRLRSVRQRSLNPPVAAMLGGVNGKVVAIASYGAPGSPSVQPSIAGRKRMSARTV